MDYTNLYDFQTRTGIIVPDDESVLLGIQKKFQEIFGTDIDLSSETPVGRLIEAFAVVVKSTLGVTAQTANQFNVNEATGLYLDSIAQVYNLKRIAGTKTRINIRCYISESAQDVTIGAGSLIMCSSTGTIFSIDSTLSSEDFERDGDGRKYVSGTATATITGPILAPEGSVNSIQTGKMGWIGVTNISPTYIGTNLETDEALRKRIIESRPIGVGFNTHLTSALNRLDGVNSNCILENPTESYMIKQDVTLPPHSIFVCVDCIETDELLHDIASAISRAKPTGIGMVNTGVPNIEAVEIKIPYGYNNKLEQNIYFYKAKRTPILVELTYSVGNYTGDNIVEDINKYLSDYVSTIGVGGTVYGTMIANHLINKLNIGIGNVEVVKNGSTIPADSSVEMMGYETPFTDAEHITSTLIK